MANGNKKKQEKYFAAKKAEDLSAFYSYATNRAAEVDAKLKAGETVTTTIFDALIFGPYLITGQIQDNQPAKI